MIIQEFFSVNADAPNPTRDGQAAQEGYRTDGDDNTNVKMRDSRKTRLTLAHLSKLRKMKDVRMVEKMNKLKLVQQQYNKNPGGGEDEF